MRRYNGVRGRCWTTMAQGQGQLLNTNSAQGQGELLDTTRTQGLEGLINTAMEWGTGAQLDRHGIVAAGCTAAPRSRRSGTHSCHHGHIAASGRSVARDRLDKTRVQGKGHGRT